MRTGIIIGAAAIVLLVSPFFIYRHAKYASVREVTFTINKLPSRDQQYNANGNKNAYANLVYTTAGTFNNVDSTYPWKQNSSDLYGMLEQGKKYKCEVAGWRIGLFSSYPDLIKCEGAK